MRTIVTPALLLIALTLPAFNSGAHSQQSTSHVQAAFIAIVVPDVEAAVTWYGDKLGLKVLSRTDSPSAQLAGPGLEIELKQSKAPPSVDGSGGACRVEKAGVVLDKQLYAEILSRLREKQARFIGREVGGPGGLRTFIVEDNNGVRLQFLTR